MTAVEVLLLLGCFCLWLAALAVLGWWLDRKLESERKNLPPPDKRTVVGQSHKPWM